MKKTISFLLCVILILFSSVSAFAAETEICATDNLYEYEVLDTITINDGYAKMISTSEGVPKDSGIKFIDLSNDELQKISFPHARENSLNVYLPSTDGYECWHFLKTGSGKMNNTLKFNNTGGEYERIKIKLSSYLSYFGEKGTYTVTLFGDTHKYNFTEEGDGYSSSLVFISGGAITGTAPDKNGYVELYVSKEFAVSTIYSTEFRHGSASGGGVSGSRVNGLTIGDVDKQGAVTILDATMIQKSIALVSEPLDKLSRRNADTNGDGKINILDATKIQKYLAKMSY